MNITWHPGTSSSNGANAPFIVETGIDRAAGGNRRLIRRHVMIGRNKGKVREAKRKKSKFSAVAIDFDIWSSESFVRLQKKVASAIPIKVGSDLSFTEFADSVGHSLLADVMYFSSVAKKALFPLEPCTTFKDRNRYWLQPLATDAAYLHTMIFSTQDYFATASRGENIRANYAASVHFLKAIQLLRARFSDSQDASVMSDVTVTIVLALSMHAQMLGQYATAREHMSGLRKIVDLRGGTTSFRANPKLLHEILRNDLNITLQSGEIPFFFLGSPRETLWPFPSSLTSSFDMIPATSTRCMDERLSAIWNIMRRFSSKVKETIGKSDRFAVDMLLDMMAASAYRLLDLSFGPSSIDEMIRLSLLAFCSKLFLQFRDLRLHYTHLCQQYKACVVRLYDLDHHQHDLWIWLLFVGATSLFNKEENVWLKLYLKEQLIKSGIHAWTEAKTVLTSCVWVDLVFDRPGEDVFDSVFR